MARSTTTYFVDNITHFPAIIDGRINLVNFLEAVEDLVSLIERLGKVFAPVKYDMQGNIAKVKKFYVFDETSCLLEVMMNEVNKDKFNGVESILWLNRTLLFFELIFHEILQCLQANNLDVNMKKIYLIAYEGSVKKYHNWVTQKLFSFISRMSPSFTQIMQSLEVDNDIKTFELSLATFNIRLHLIRCKLDDFFIDNQLFEE